MIKQINIQKKLIKIHIIQHILQKKIKYTSQTFHNKNKTKNKNNNIFLQY